MASDAHLARAARLMAARRVICLEGGARGIPARNTTSFERDSAAAVTVARRLAAGGAVRRWKELRRGFYDCNPNVDIAITAGEKAAASPL